MYALRKKRFIITQVLAQKFLETVTSPAYKNAMPRTDDFNAPGGRIGTFDNKYE